MSLFHGPNAGYVHELYERFRQDPESVDASTRAMFEQWTPPDIAEEGEAFTEPSGSGRGHCDQTDVKRILAASRVVRFTRDRGHLAAHVDPLGTQPLGDPFLGLARHGLETHDLAELPASVVGGPLADDAPNALEAFNRLRKVYSGSIGYEMGHIQVAEERVWLREAIESSRFFQGFDDEFRRDLLEHLTEVEVFERFLHRTPPYANQKRFSLEGTDMLVPMLDEIIAASAENGCAEVVLGMAHRGRLNVLAHVLGKSYAAILSEFANPQRADNIAVSGRGSHGWTGDVKYHLGHRRVFRQRGVQAMPVSLVPNPSHLEFVNPVVEGHVRAAQDRRDVAGPPTQNEKSALPVLIHGDAAFPGQGIVAETLNMSGLVGYRTGGTIHIIVNNQIGFTTQPSDSRSTLYSSDLAKGFEIPIVHVNADDPEACIAIARMALAYRAYFRKDFMIDVIGYRRWGHNEGDEPAFTQPRMYSVIASHPTVREVWAKVLEASGVVSAEDAAQMEATVHEKLMIARGNPPAPSAEDEEESVGKGISPAVVTAVEEERLCELNDMLLRRPTEFHPNSRLERILERRQTLLREPNGIDWAHAESLAFAAILADGTPVRMSGQDTERGTFGQRNLVLHDVENGSRYCPLQALPLSNASFAVYNSPLSENAALGFEYGYSMHAPGVLVLWEAQFGDFANSAQVMIDQFLVSGNAKWRQTPSLVLLLPHGYEGQGPEHSSARVERFLQLCANDNIRVANCTTSAQYFHILRRQAALLQTDPRPLVLITPKSLLRHPAASSSLGDFTSGTFHPVLDDEEARLHPEQVTRMILSSGKVYTDLVYDATTRAPREAFLQDPRIAAVRIEELYPFPEEDLRRIFRGYPNLVEVVWMQEEPANMGAWSFVAPRIRELADWKGDLIYAGRRESASTAEGSSGLHAAEQARIIAKVLRGVPEIAVKAAV